MNKFVEPMVNLPWDIYLDWLADQGFDDLRDINPGNFLSLDDYTVILGDEFGELSTNTIFCGEGIKWSDHSIHRYHFYEVQDGHDRSVDSLGNYNQFNLQIMNLSISLGCGIG